MQSLERPPDRAEWASAVGGFGEGERELERFDEQLRIMVRRLHFAKVCREALVRRSFEQILHSSSPNFLLCPDLTTALPAWLQELAKDRMITSNLRLVVSIAKKYANRGVNIQDLIQEGSFGLITAVDKFDPQHKCRFSTYAHYWIKQSVTRALADFSRTIRLPVHMNDCVNSIRKTRTNFFLNEGRQPSDEELAASLRISQV